jgi:hypothetical protein
MMCSLEQVAGVAKEQAAGAERLKRNNVKITPDRHACDFRDSRSVSSLVRVALYSPHMIIVEI